MKHYRYIYQDNRRTYQPEYEAPVQMVDSRSIPMPNEEEKTQPMPSRSPFTTITGFLNNISFEDLILIGLILLLISEGFDDDILILLLVYVLIS